MPLERAILTLDRSLRIILGPLMEGGIHLSSHMIAHNPRFSVFTSGEVQDAAGAFADEELGRWIAWYRALYML